MKMMKKQLLVLPGRVSLIDSLFFQLRFLSDKTRAPKFDGSLASMHTISSNHVFSLLGLCRNVGTLMKSHALLIVQGLGGDLLCDTKLVSLYGSFGNLEYARLLFDKMPERDFYSWKVMLRGYFLHDLHVEIIWFYNRMRMCVRDCDNVVFSIVLKACSQLGEIKEGRKVHCHMVKAGKPDSFLQAVLVDMYAKCGKIDCSHDAFTEILEKDVVSWTSLIAGYVQNDCAEEGLNLFNRMREAKVKSNEFTLGSLVTACAKLRACHQGKWVHGYLIKIGIGFNSYLVTALLDMYVKCGAITDAGSIFDELSSIDLVSWTAMIVGYTQSICPEKALKLFIDKKWIGILPNAVTLTSVLSACARLGNLDFGTLVHGLMVKLGLEEPMMINALVDMYCKCRNIEDARNLFVRVSDKDVVAWNSMISGYSQNGYVYEALELFHQMRLESFSPDAVTLASILSCCASLGALQVGSSVHAYSLKEGLMSSNVYVGTALLNFYAKCGDAQSARIIFDSMEEKTSVTWGAMIGGYGMQGDGFGSLELFHNMLKENLEPTEVIFTSVLSACSHTGMVGEGWGYFNSMCQDFGLVPTMKHYACMVDLLARAGRLEEALNFMDNMPIEPDVSSFGAFLHGCGLYSRFDLGELAIRRMLELHPDEACYYVLISNLYASDGRWSQVNQLRELMNQRQLNKFPACSIVEMDIHNDLSSTTVECLA
ncbi:hypothetical protein SLEP1_g12454 [Rubroshorea leprosula]|uniref:Pentatricopeptide repeat-containing protein n=1 Tax=Rubroshorea leprosula TaxID=152421 RepID=A0AAV5IL85_9ROSI|nr:hypothetical protein SLEP1_g12454 [Rubroshorea leprosula]